MYFRLSLIKYCSKKWFVSTNITDKVLRTLTRLAAKQQKKGSIVNKEDLDNLSVMVNENF